MKYRILKRGTKYYPQYKGWFRWKYFIRCRYEWSELVRFDVMESAQGYIDDHVRTEQIKAIREVHAYTPQVREAAEPEREPEVSP